jgi:hypothetical protein
MISIPMQPKKRQPQEAAVFDLDGCISDDEWRIPLIDYSSSTERYNLYHARLGQDQVLEKGLNLLKEQVALKRKIIFVTARPITYAQQTREWLRDIECLHAQDPYLYMRPENNKQSSPTLKIDIVRRITANGRFKIMVAYDDRADVVAAYHGEKIPAFILNRSGVHLPPATDQSCQTMYKFLFPQRKVDEILGVVDDVRIDSNWADSLSNISAKHVATVESKPRTAADILAGAADTFRERNAVYRDNAVMVGQVMECLFPDGVTIKTKEDHHFYHLFELIIVKLTRFANSELRHKDSIHDLMVYAAMVENLVEQHNIQTKGTEK